MVGLGQTTNGNDRSRTYWTPTMERFFIDLMLEQLHKGARIGHTFNKQAWTEMLALFNDKFGSQYDKEVLKSRYTNLWKQFNDVKSLLAQSGFAWDETRQMVVADEYLWDSYIKAHPDARLYKTKAVLNFNDLCLIYGYTTADGRYSRSSHDVDFDDDIHGMSVGDGTYSLDHLNNSRQRTDWTPEMDHHFIELMLDQVGRGNKLANTFNKQAWMDMIALFNAKFGPQHGKRVLRHRHKKLLKYYSDVTLLLKQEGFSWSETQRMVVADDQVWDTYTKIHPHTRSYRSKVLPNYYDLILIFGNGFDTGLNSLNMEQNLGYDVAQLIAGRGSPASCINDRTRTYWTPPMDRYLVDLLLDHVHRGNKLGQTFTSQAWMDMAASFNAQFKSYHDKDVLKNRYKHLRRQYNDIKLLLEQNGFSWDEAREMILAEDHVWDAYTKAHPDARTYRVKTFPEFHKLCAIFGEEQSDGRYSRLARDADLVCELPKLMTGEETNVRSLASAVSSRINWTPEVDCFLINLMLQQVQEGHKIGDTFDEQAWACMVDTFSKNYGLQCNKHFLEDRYIWLKKRYESISKVLSCSGFMWDETQQMVVADDDVWVAYIKERPDAVSYRSTCLNGYSDLQKICQSGETVESINGQLAEMIFNDQCFEMIRDCQIPEAACCTSSLEIAAEGLSGNLPLSTNDVCMSEKLKKRTSSRAMDMGLGHSNKIQKTESQNIQTLSEVADLVAELVSKNEKKNDQPMVSAIDALQAMPDIDDDLLLDACDLLEDERKAKTFLALDVALRKKWLLRKLRPQL